MRTLLAILSLAAAATAAPRPAHACGDGGATGAIVVAAGIGLGLGATDVALTIKDLVDPDSGDGYATFEAVVTVPQAVILGAITVDMLSEGAQADETMLAAGLFAWTSALAVHAIWELADDDAPPRADRVTLMPTAVTDGAQVGGGLGIGGAW
jgi:hypothetical protein